MPVSGLVLTLSEDPKLRAVATESLCHHPAIELGELQRHRLPVVVDTLSSEEDRLVWEWLHHVPGVVFVDLVCADTSQDTRSDDPDSNQYTPSGADDSAVRGLP